MLPLLRRVLPPGFLCPSIPLTYTGTLDMTNNIIIIQTDSQAASVAAYKNLYKMVQSAYQGGAYTGTGITSSYAAADANGLAFMGLNLELNDNSPVDPITGPPMDPSDAGFTEYDGVHVNADSVILAYGFIGDSFLQGFLNFNEVTTVAFAFELLGWFRKWRNRV